MSVGTEKTDVLRPLFLLGAGRSGTTLLYKLLCLHPKVAYISNYDVRFPPFAAHVFGRLANPDMAGKLASWFSRQGNAYFVQRPMVRRFIRTPVEGEALYAACGIPLSPASQQRLEANAIRKIRQRFSALCDAYRADTLVTKRTANNRRIHLLEQAFPDARYVHLLRDGRAVARSLAKVEWWRQHTVWWDGRTADAMERAGMSRAEICARNWAEEIRAIRSGLQNVDAQRVTTIRFDELLGEPVSILRTILAFAQVPMAEEYFDAIRELGLSRRTPDNIGITPEFAAAIETHQSSLLAELGFTGPAEVQS